MHHHLPCKNPTTPLTLKIRTGCAIRAGLIIPGAMTSTRELSLHLPNGLEHMAPTCRAGHTRILHKSTVAAALFFYTHATSRSGFVKILVLDLIGDRSRSSCTYQYTVVARSNFPAHILNYRRYILYFGIKLFRNAIG